MKKSFLMVGLLVTCTLTGCQETIDGAELAIEVCECNTLANSLPDDDPGRRAEQDKCSELQKTNWEKVRGKTDQENAFNDQFPCGF